MPEAPPWGVRLPKDKEPTHPTDRDEDTSDRFSRMAMEVPHRIEYALALMNKYFTGADLDDFESKCWFNSTFC